MGHRNDRYSICVLMRICGFPAPVSLEPFRHEPPLMQLWFGIPKLHGIERRLIEGLCGERHHRRQGSALPLRIATIDMRAGRHGEIEPGAAGAASTLVTVSCSSPAGPSQTRHHRPTPHRRARGQCVQRSPSPHRLCSPWPNRSSVRSALRHVLFCATRIRAIDHRGGGSWFRKHPHVIASQITAVLVGPCGGPLVKSIDVLMIATRPIVTGGGMQRARLGVNAAAAIVWMLAAPMTPVPMLGRIRVGVGRRAVGRRCTGFLWRRHALVV